MKCKNCDTEFPLTRLNRKFCSKECRQNDAYYDPNKYQYRYGHKISDTEALDKANVDYR